MGYLRTEGAACPAQNQDGVLRLADQASPLPRPCPRVHQSQLSPRRPSPRNLQPLRCPAPVHTPGLRPQPCGPLAFCALGHSLAREAQQTRPRSRAVGLSPREPGLALQVDAVTGSFIDPGPLAWRSPLTFGSGRWVPGLLHAGLGASVCPDQGLPTPYPASLGWINGPQPWPGCLALVPCGLWPQAPRASCWAGDSTAAEHVNRPEAGGRQCPAPPRPAPPRGHPGGWRAGAGDLSSPSRPVAWL